MFMMFISVLVSLLSLTAAAPTTDECSQLIRYIPAGELSEVLGKWNLIEVFSTEEKFKPFYESYESAWIDFHTTADNHTLLLNFGARLVPNPQLNDPCVKGAINVTLSKDSSDLEIFVNPELPNYKFLRTSSDSLVIHQKDKFDTLQIFGKSDTIPDPVLETFKKQAACLQFTEPPLRHYDNNKEQCQ